MLTRLFAAASVAACMLAAAPAHAQSPIDTAYFNLGRVKLPKNLTQHITVKGTDLQRLPFSNLSDALTVWFNGAYTYTTGVVYVVDGNIITDVNQYAVFDIEEVTLVQNAIAQVNGISQNQQLILITTKRNLNGKGGITVSGQVNAVQLHERTSSTGVSDDATGNNGGTKKSAGLYQQYYLSAYKNINQVHLGVSANYLYSKLPEYYASDLNVHHAPELNRWRLNGYLNAPLWKGTNLDVTAGYAPQTSGYDFAYNTGLSYQFQYKGTDHILNGNLNLTSQIIPGLTNQLRAGYNKYNSHNEQYLNMVSPSISGYSDLYDKSKVLTIYDDLRYQYQIQNWTLTPAVNFNYRNIDFSSIFSQSQSTNATPNASSLNSITQKGKSYLLTPTLGIGYKDVLNVTGGFLFILNSAKNLNPANPDVPKKSFPFVSASLNASKLIMGSAGFVDVNLYGSYALSNLFGDAYSVLKDESQDASARINNTYSPSNSFINYYFYYTPNVYFKTLSLGTALGFLHNKFTLSYNFDKRKNYTNVIESYYANGQSYSSVVPAPTEIYMHRVGLDFNIIAKGDVRWRSSLNATNMKQKISYPFIYGPAITGFQKNWTGGWANRMRVNSFIAGLDILYLIQGQYNNSTIPAPDSFSLQNLYVGTRLRSRSFKQLEIYLNGRNLVENKKSTLPDNRRYFGLGITAGL